MDEKCQQVIPEEPIGVTLVEHSDWDVSEYVQRLLKELDRAFAAVELYTKQIHRKQQELGRAKGDLAQEARRGSRHFSALAEELEEL